MLTGVEKDGIALERPPGFEVNGGQHAVGMIEARDRFGPERNVVTREPLAHAMRRTDPVRAQHDVRAPGTKRLREPRRRAAAAERGEAAIAAFPAVAVRAVKDGAPVALLEA